MPFLGDLGIWVPRATEQFPDPAGGGNPVDIFTIAGGPILLTSLIGVVTVIMDATATTLQLQHMGTANLTTISGAGTDTADDAVGTVYSIDGVLANNVVKVEAAVIGAGAVGRMTNGIVMIPGTIQFVAGDVNTGWVAWTICYIPLVDGATVVVA